jgi:hypothetical protein
LGIAAQDWGREDPFRVIFSSMPPALKTVDLGVFWAFLGKNGLKMAKIGRFCEIQPDVNLAVLRPKMGKLCP